MQYCLFQGEKLKRFYSIFRNATSYALHRIQLLTMTVHPACHNIAVSTSQHTKRQAPVTKLFNFRCTSNPTSSHNNALIISLKHNQDPNANAKLPRSETTVLATKSWHRTKQRYIACQANMPYHLTNNQAQQPQSNYPFVCSKSDTFKQQNDRCITQE